MVGYPSRYKGQTRTSAAHMNHLYGGGAPGNCSVETAGVSTYFGMAIQNLLINNKYLLTKDKHSPIFGMRLRFKY